jgi:hypothetical protein
MFSSNIKPEDAFFVIDWGWKTCNRFGSWPGKFASWIGPWLLITEWFLAFKDFSASFSAVSLARSAGKWTKLSVRDFELFVRYC